MWYGWMCKQAHSLNEAARPEGESACARTPPRTHCATTLYIHCVAGTPSSFIQACAGCCMMTPLRAHTMHAAPWRACTCVRMCMPLSHTQAHVTPGGTFMTTSSFKCSPCRSLTHATTKGGLRPPAAAAVAVVVAAASPALKLCCCVAARATASAATVPPAPAAAGWTAAMGPVPARQSGR